MGDGLGIEGNSEDILETTIQEKKPTYNEAFQNQHSTVIIKNDLLRLAMASFYPLRKREGDIMPNLFVDNYVSRSKQREISELLFYY